MVIKRELGLQRSHSDLAYNGGAAAAAAKMSWKSRVNGRNAENKLNAVFARPPSLVEDNIDILKSWADFFAKQVNDAFSSVESLVDEEEQEAIGLGLQTGPKPPNNGLANGAANCGLYSFFLQYHYTLIPRWIPKIPLKKIKS